MLSININSLLGFMLKWMVIYSTKKNKSLSCCCQCWRDALWRRACEHTVCWSVRRGMQWLTEVGFGAENCKKYYLYDPPQLVVPLQSPTLHSYQFVFFYFCGGIDPENDWPFPFSQPVYLRDDRRWVTIIIFFPGVRKFTQYCFIGIFVKNILYKSLPQTVCSCLNDEK